MNGLGRLRNRVFGTIVPSIQSVVAQDIDELVEQLIEDAAEIWRAAAWHRFDDKEANCTIQMYRCSREVQRRNAMYGVLAIRIEFVMPTPAMFDGLEDATGMARPDIHIAVGEVGRIVECKRLSLGGGKPRAYVHEGITRFVCGPYASEGDAEYMIGYLQADDVDQVVAEVNRQVVGHPVMDGSDVLHPAPPARPLAASVHHFRSEHKRQGVNPFHIRHKIIDVRPVHDS